MLTILVFALAAVAGTYQALALIAAVAHMLHREPQPPEPPPPISILKPIHGLDPSFYEAIRSHAVQDYPQVEMLFGVRTPDDPAVPAILRLIEEFPDRNIRLIECDTEAPNGKVGVLEDLSNKAAYPVLLVNDSDIRVPPDYLRRVVAYLGDKQNGMVTCLYSADADTVPGKWEALGISTDFAPSVLVARVVGVREFGMGSTLCFRRAQLESVGGFKAIRDYLADDYQLARRITALGYRGVVAKVPVTTHVGDTTWSGVWRHQVRWARTIRVSRGGGYAGLPVTHAGLWALVAAAAGHWNVAVVLATLRIASGLVTACGVLGNTRMVFAAPLIVLWDLWAFAVWLAGASGNSVVWRGRTMQLTPDGKIPERTL